MKRNKLAVTYFDGAKLEFSVGGKGVTVDTTSGQAELNELFSTVKVLQDMIAAISNTKRVKDEEELQAAQLAAQISAARERMARSKKTEVVVN